MVIFNGQMGNKRPRYAHIGNVIQYGTISTLLGGLHNTGWGGGIERGEITGLRQEVLPTPSQVVT